MRKIIEFIKFNFWYFIIRPLKKLYNFLFNRAYLPLNSRNIELLEYCSKIVNDESYQASTPVEHWIDKEWEDMYKQITDDFIANNKELTEEELMEIVVPYSDYRQTIASQVLLALEEYAFVREKVDN
jgi:hypothetical protein